MRRSVALISVALVLAIGLSGCIGRYAPPGFQPTPDAESIEGTWTHADGTGVDATIRFDLDGTFEYHAIPAPLVTGGGASADSVSTADRVDGEGTWSIDPDSSPPAVNLGPDRAYPALHPLSVLPFGFDTLYFTMGDPDLGDFYRFERD